MSPLLSLSPLAAFLVQRSIAAPIPGAARLVAGARLAASDPSDSTGRGGKVVSAVLPCLVAGYVIRQRDLRPAAV